MSFIIIIIFAVCVYNIFVLIRKNHIQKTEINLDTWYLLKDGKYKGEWKNGKPHGKGIKEIFGTNDNSCLSIIEGNFVDGFAEGHCKQTFIKNYENNVPYYEGNFVRDKYCGEGEYHFANGDYYTGNFENDKFSGKGEYYFASGNYYRGEFKNHKYHGKGLFYSKKINKTYIGNFRRDKKIDGELVDGKI